MRAEMGLKVMSEVMTAVSSYDEIIHWLLQSGVKQYVDRCNQYFEFFKSKSKDGKYLDYNSLQYWKAINLHVVQQTWGSTARGWGGMGGASMTTDYTTIIENVWTGAIFVFYNGNLAYIASGDNAVKEYKSNGFRDLPPYYETNNLDIIYKHRQK